MKKYLVWGILALSILQPVWAKDSGARFSSISKEVEVFPETDPGAIFSAKPNTTLNVDDHIMTGEGSNAVVTFADLSTLMIKAESEIVIASPELQSSRVDVRKGSLWLNVKKIVLGDAIEVKSNLATTGIKGTTITCRTRSDKSEDLIQVLRGTAEVTNLVTSEKTMLEAGQELLIKGGGTAARRTIDVDKEADKWKEELSGIGSAIDIQDIPDAVGAIDERLGLRYKTLKSTFSSLADFHSPEAQEFQKEAGRFLSALIEDDLILGNFTKKIDQALAGRVTPFQAGRLTALQKRISEAKKRAQSYLGEIGIMLKRFAAAGQLDELGQAQQKIGAIWGEVEKLRQELEGSPTGLSQNWFEETREFVITRMEELQQVIANIQALLEKEGPKDDIQTTLKQAEKVEKLLAQFLRDLSIPFLDSELILRLQERADQLSFEIANLHSEVETYANSMANARLEDRIRASLGLIRRFSIAKREYIQAQRLYASVNRAGGRRYRTTEQLEFDELFQQIEDDFQQLETVYEDIKTGQAFLESQLGILVK